MKPYADLHGDPAIQAYDYGDDWIRVQFEGGQVYEYRMGFIGSVHFNEMMARAQSGQKLNAYIQSSAILRRYAFPLRMPLERVAA